jgi:amino acid transporter
MLNTVSAWWHMAGVLFIVAVLVIVPDHHQSASFVFTQTINNTGFSGHNFGSIVFWFVFATGLLMAQYTITGYDASAHMSEETKQASRGAAWGLLMSVVVSVFFGFILLVAVTFAVPDVKGTLSAGGYDVQYIWDTSLGRHWAELLLFIAVLAQLFCTIASVTSASRMNFAFSRDRAVPGHQLWAQVSKRDRVPIWSVWMVAALAFMVMVPTLWNAYVGYQVGTSVAVIGLYIAFVLPIILRLKAGDAFEKGAWSLGRHYKWIDSVAIVWIVFICLVFIMPVVPQGIPWRSDFSWQLANYTLLTVGGSFVLFGGWYLLSARKWFKGPIRQGSEEELARIERELGEAPAAPATAPA